MSHQEEGSVDQPIDQDTPDHPDVDQPQKTKPTTVKDYPFSRLYDMDFYLKHLGLDASDIVEPGLEDWAKTPKKGMCLYLRMPN